MKLAISGKGGSGKTTIAGTLARIYAREGHHVVAIDGDPNPNLAVTLGIPAEMRAEIRPLPRDLMVEKTDAGGKKTQVLGTPPETVAAQYGVIAPDDVVMLLGSRVDHPGRG